VHYAFVGFESERMITIFAQQQRWKYNNLKRQFELQLWRQEQFVTCRYNKNNYNVFLFISQHINIDFTIWSSNWNHFLIEPYQYDLVFIFRIKNSIKYIMHLAEFMFNTKSKYKSRLNNNKLQIIYHLMINVLLPCPFYVWDPPGLLAIGSCCWVIWGLRSLNAAFPCWSCSSYFHRLMLSNRF
jgi:hypothetical protein